MINVQMKRNLFQSLIGGLILLGFSGIITTVILVYKTSIRVENVQSDVVELKEEQKGFLTYDTFVEYKDGVVGLRNAFVDNNKSAFEQIFARLSFIENNCINNNTRGVPLNNNPKGKDTSDLLYK